MVRRSNGGQTQTRRTGWLVLAVLCLTPHAWAADARRTRAVPIARNISLDGDLTKPTWTEVEPIGDFVQREPRPGQPPTEPTEVRIAYSSSALLIAVNCLDSSPGRIIAREMKRDSNLQSDDRILILLDTYGDGQNAYYFATNPAGALVDGRITSSSAVDLSWDGIWEVRTRVNQKGWTAEIEIPFKTLGFKAGRSEWGFNIARFLGRLREESRWASASLDAQFTNVSRAGVIEHLENLSQGVGLDVKPYLLAGLDRGFSGPDSIDWARDVGMDVFYRITPNLISSTTINTDFAETEVDTRQINLTRFPLLFPEKRSFFLEDDGVFQFAPTNHGQDFIPFFSRRIGLLGGREVPLFLGQKLTGKVSRFDVGLFGVRTSDSELAPPQTFIVGRVKANVFQQSYVGALFTDGEPTGLRDNRTFGLDTRLSTSNLLGTRKNFWMMAFGSRSATRGIDRNDDAYGLELNYPNDLWVFRYTYRVIGQNYRPALGFVPRPGVRLSEVRAEYDPRPTVWNIRQIFYKMEFTWYENLIRQQPESRRYWTSVRMNFHGGEVFEFNFAPTYEQLFEPFEIHDGVEITPGVYWFNYYRVMGSTAPNKRLFFSGYWRFGTFYTGRQNEVRTQVSWRRNRHFGLDFDLQQFFVRLREGEFRTRLASVRSDYNFTPFVSLSNFIQYDTDSRNIGLQSRFGWILQPGSELLLVLNHGWQENLLDRWESTQTKVRAKFQYTLRF
jgi:hypothetical protein